MLGWMIMIGAGGALALLGSYLSHRWGRGAYKTTFKRPENEIQNAHPWKIWP